MKQLFTTAVLGLAALAAMASNPPLRIYEDRGKPDTVSRSTYYLVGVTSPQAKAWINGEEAHVYRTGSFGAEIVLKEGRNVIPVKVQEGRKKTEIKREVYFNPPKTRAAAVAAVEVTSTLAEPVYLATDSGAYLQYGNGGDRLGGSKIGFLDEGVQLTAVGETSGLYKVQLSDNYFAYVPKGYVHTASFNPAVVNSGSASLANIGKSDRVSISLPRRVAYTSTTMIDPQVIKVSLYGVTNNTNWLTQRNNLGIVEYVDLQQESDVMHLYIRLNDSHNWGYSVHYQGNSLVIDVRHRPASLALADLTIGLDAGHGGEYPGARSPSGLLEKDVNLDIVLKMADILRAKGAKVVLTREGDTGPSMTERKLIWRDANVDLAISVHNNASGNPLVPIGTSSYYKHLCNRGFAKSLHESMLTLGISNFGLVGNFNFSLNGPTEYPNALVEVLFMSSLPEEELLADPEFRGKVAAKIVAGLENYLREADKK